jgi:hypothetical protein
MGGIASLNLLNHIRGVNAWAGIFPVCNVASTAANPLVKPSIDAAYPYAPTYLNDFSPVAITGDVPMLFWASPGDTVVPMASNATPCAAAAVADGGEARVIPTQGEHGDPSNYDGDTLLAFFDSH